MPGAVSVQIHPVFRAQLTSPSHSHLKVGNGASVAILMFDCRVVFEVVIVMMLLSCECACDNGEIIRREGYRFLNTSDPYPAATRSVSRVLPCCDLSS